MRTLFLFSCQIKKLILSKATKGYQPVKSSKSDRAVEVEASLTQSTTTLPYNTVLTYHHLSRITNYWFHLKTDLVCDCSVFHYDSSPRNTIRWSRMSRLDWNFNYYLQPLFLAYAQRTSRRCSFDMDVLLCVWREGKRSLPLQTWARSNYCTSEKRVFFSDTNKNSTDNTILASSSTTVLPRKYYKLAITYTYT